MGWRELLVIGAVERHVQGADDDHAPVDGDGFLDLGSATGIAPAGDLVGRPGSFVLLASGGVGKSVVLDELRRWEDGVEVDLVGLRGADIGREVGAAVESGKPVYLDSLDEALLFEPALVQLLNRAMSGFGAEGVRWRLACRPSAWMSAFVDGVTSFERLRLLPVTRDAARRLLVSIDVDEGFLEALAAAGQSRLSASLLHFIAAARQWQKEGHLPGRRRDVLESEVQRLLAEREDLRPMTLRTGVDVRHRVADRLAFFAAFGGVARFAFRTGADQAAAAITGLPTVPEPDRPDVTIGREVYEEVLGSALFDAAPRDTVVFRHQEYVDYLAAKYVVDREPVRSQVADLLGLTDGVLPRSMTAVAAWMVALRPEIVDVVAPANATALVESEVDLPPGARMAVVDALLADAREHDAPPRWSLDLSVVVHPELEHQLTKRLATGVIRPFEAWWICRLALAGRVSAAAPAALMIALDGQFLSWARRPAIAVVTALGTESERSALLDGLKLDTDADPDDELRAGLLEGLYPRHMTIARLLPFITRPRQSNFIGAYEKYLWEFADRILDADLPEVLAWARELTLQPQDPFESRRWSSDLSVRLVARAVAASDDPAVLEPLAELVVQLARHTRVGAPWAQDTSRRRRLALAVAARLDEHRWAALLRLGLLTADDVDWLANAVGDHRSTEHDTLARCLHWLIAPPTPTDDEPETDQEEAEDRPDPAALRAAIAAARQDLAAWPGIPIALVRREDPNALFFCDLTSRQGWPLLTTGEQREVLDRGLDYVTGHSPHPGLWLGKTTVGFDVIRDWSGVYLLTTLARHAAERLRDLPPTAWVRWAPAIANAWAHRDEHLLGELVDLAPAEAKAEILTAVRAALNSRAEWRRTPLHECFARDLVADLAVNLQQRRYPDDQNANALVFLTEHDPNLAVVTARSVAGGDGSQLSHAANRYLASVDSSGTIDRLLSEPIAPGAFLELLQGLRLDTVGDGRLAALARLLLGRFPLADDDPRAAEGWSSDSPAQRAARIRNNTIQVLAMRGCSTELRALADGQPPQEQELIRYYLYQARQVAADMAQVRLGPAALLDLLGRSDFRLVRNSGDLIDVLTAHLDELQHELSRGNGFRDLWSPDGKDLGSEDDITDWVRRRLTDRLGRDRIILIREPQVERLTVKGSGTRIDLAAGAPTNTAPIGVAAVTIEAKLVTNDEVPTALRNQLVKRYLAATGQRYGIYLVYWTPPEQRRSGLSGAYADKQQLLDDMRRWAAEVAPQYEVGVYALDVSWPNRRS